jgi:tetratricopeptide (TPR) repeat protein
VIKVIRLVVLIAGLIAVLFAANVFWLNLANVNLAHAPALPTDSPQRTTLLANAQAQLQRADRNNPRVALAQARLELARGEPARAIEALRATGTALQNDSIAQWVWAEAEWQSSNPGAAFEHWRNAGAFTFFINETNRARFNHRWQEAERLARIALGIAPANVEAQYALGDVLGYLDADAALRELARAEDLTRDPELLATILSRQGEILAARGESAAALVRFERAMQIAPRDARPRTDAARLLLATQPEARARVITLLHESLDVAPWYIAAYITLAEIAEADGDVRTAEDWYARGLARVRNNPDLLFARAKFYARQNRLEQAKTDLILAMQNETRADERAKIARELEALNAR